MRRRGDPMMRAVREADPAASPQVAGWAETSEAALIADRIRTEGDRDVQVWQPMRRRRGGRLAIVVAVVVIAASAVAASVALRPRTPAIASLVACYPELSIGSSPVLLVTHGVAPLELCGRVWQNASGRQTPPRLVACVRSEGGLGVFPLPRGLSAADGCKQVGGAPYSDGESAG